MVQSEIPPEVVDLIAWEVLRPRDLLRFALVHSTFRDIVIPLHLHYRVVERSVDDGAFWTHLQENPRRLQNIRFLKLHTVIQEPRFNEHWYEALKICPPTVPDGALALLPPALLARMTGLVSFDWQDQSGHWQASEREEIPRSFSSLPHFRRYQDELWTSLTCSIPSLENVRLNGSLGTWRCPRERESEKGHWRLETPALRLENLRSLTIRFPSCWKCIYGSSNVHSFHLERVLRSTNRLRSLNLEGPYESFQFPILPDAIRLPALEDLHITTASFASNHQSFLKFLSAHKSIRIFRWDWTHCPMPPGALDFLSASNALPNLTMLSGLSREIQVFLRPLSNGTARPIRSLSCWGLRTNANPRELLDLSHVGPTLRDLTLGDIQSEDPNVTLAHVVHFCPNLRRLRLESRDWTMPVWPWHNILDKRYLQPLMSLLSLKVFSIKDDGRRQREGKVPTECIQASLQVLPHLRYLFLPRAAVIIAFKEETPPLPPASTVAWGSLKGCVYPNLTENDFKAEVQALVGTPLVSWMV